MQAGAVVRVVTDELAQQAGQQDDAGDALQDGVDELVLVAEVAVDDRLRDPGAAGDVVDRECGPASRTASTAAAVSSWRRARRCSVHRDRRPSGDRGVRRWDFGRRRTGWVTRRAPSPWRVRPPAPRPSRSPLPSPFTAVRVDPGSAQRLVDRHEPSTRLLGSAASAGSSAMRPYRRENLRRTPPVGPRVHPAFRYGVGNVRGRRGSTQESSALGELGRVEADRGGRGQVEALRTPAHRDADPGVGRAASSGGTPRASLPNSHITGPASSVAGSLVERRPHPRRRRPAPSPRRPAPGEHRQQGRAPDDVDVEQAARARADRLAPVGVGRAGAEDDRAAPQASAVRKTVPALPGSASSASATDSLGGCAVNRVSAGTSRSAQTATRPCGVTVSDSPAAAFSVTRRTGTAVPASRSAWARAAASVAKTSRTPSASASASTRPAAPRRGTVRRRPGRRGG